MDSKQILPADKLPGRYRRVAILHDWLTGMRGGEAILEALCELFPQADLLTLFWTDKQMSSSILNGRTVKTSWLQPIIDTRLFRQKYQNFLPLFPLAVRSLDVSSYDLILSHSHCVVKGVQKRADAKHISYISSPMRYIWDRFDDYFAAGKMPWYKTWLARRIRHPLQQWDVASTEGVDKLIANSAFVQSRIKQYWHREAEVLHPFVHLDRFRQSSFSLESKASHSIEEQDYYLIVSAFVPYKRIDLAIEACLRKKQRLVLVGKGQEEANLRRIAGGSSLIEFRGAVSNDEVARLYRSAKGFLFPGLEDFGITPLEAMASGTGIVAFAAGGALETVTPETGEFFEQQTVSALVEAMDRFEGKEITKEACRRRAEEFSKEAFKRKLWEMIEGELCLSLG